MTGTRTGSPNTHLHHLVTSSSHDLILDTVRSEAKRMSAALVLRELAEAQPAHFSYCIPEVFNHIFTCLYDVKVSDQAVDRARPHHLATLHRAAD